MESGALLIVPNNEICVMVCVLEKMEDDGPAVSGCAVQKKNLGGSINTNK